MLDRRRFTAFDWFLCILIVWMTFILGVQVGINKGRELALKECQLAHRHGGDVR